MFLLPGILFGIQLSTAYHALLLCYLVFWMVLGSYTDWSLRGEIFHMVKVYDTCIGCTQCVRACPTDVLEMAKMASNKAGAVATSPRTEDCVGCKRCESA